MAFLDTCLLLLNQLELLDKWLFSKINSQYTNIAFDYFMPYLRNSVYWAPLYLFLLVFVTINFKAKGGWWCVIFLCLIAMTDIVSSHLFKDTFERVRPCNDPSFFLNVRLLVRDCPFGYSFTSSHAANHFGMAAFFFFTFRTLFKRWAWIAFIWAAMIGYAQIYVGVHYPSDIAGGGLLGVFFGSMLALFFNKRFGMVNFDKQLAS